jgi:outer membrane protein TolC
MKKLPIKKLFLFICLIGLSNTVTAQDVLSEDQAIKLALMNNFGVLIGDNNLEIAAHNKSIMNSGFLPTLGANAGANYNLNDITANFQNGNTTELKGASSSSFNAGLNLNYTLFDGLGRWYNFKQLKEKYELSELEARTTIENAIFQTLGAYYDIAVQNNNVSVLSEAVEVSKVRVLRTTQAFNYSQGNKLSVLNAQVDLSNDSINLASAQLALANAKRNLSALLVQDINSDFSINETLKFIENFEKTALHEAMLENNVSLLQLKKNISIGQYNENISRSRYLPSLAATTQYGWNRSNNNEASFLASSTSYGLSAGATLTWNLFDGGTTRTNMQNAKLTNTNLALQYAQLENNLERDFENAWADYQNKIYLHTTQQKNLISNQDNFTRTNEQFKLALVSSVEYRQAQQNLLTVTTQVTQSKYSAKLAEIKLLQLAGLLLETEF